jgi:hypothetical protein
LGKGDKPNILGGVAVAHLNGLCPDFDSNSNLSLFGHYFGIEFVRDGHLYVWAISPIEFASCLRLSDKLTYKLSYHSNAFCLNAGIPALTLSQILEEINKRCNTICSSNFEIQKPNKLAVPAACADVPNHHNLATLIFIVHLFLSGAVGVHMPSSKTRVKAYQDDPELSVTLKFAKKSRHYQPAQPRGRKVGSQLLPGFAPI